MRMSFLWQVLALFDIPNAYQITKKVSLDHFKILNSSKIGSNSRNCVLGVVECADVSLVVCFGRFFNILIFWDDVNQLLG